MPDKALIIAVNEYEAVSGLRGCVNDAQNMAQLFTETFGFASDHVHLIKDRDARKSRVKAEIQWLFEDLRSGDRAAFHFSGHGSQIVDAQHDETDKLDELICLQDMDFARPGSYFLDDELGKLLKKCPKGVFLTVFLDCCHSGTGTRKLVPLAKAIPDVMSPRVIENATATRVAEAHWMSRRTLDPFTLDELTRVAKGLSQPDDRQIVLARYVEPPDSMLARVAAVRRARGPKAASNAFSVISGMNHVLLAACQDDQTAADAFIDRTFNGAFTYNLAKILREHGRTLDRYALVDRLRKVLQADRYEQQPRLEGPSLHGPLFTAGRKDADEDIEMDEPSVTDQTVTESPPIAAPVATTSQEVAGDGAALFRELLATYNRLLDIIQPASRFAVPLETAAVRIPEKHIVYVHGIGTHARHYSDSWWNSLKPFAPSLRPGNLANGLSSPQGNRHEVLWSDLVNQTRAVASGPSAAESAFADEVRAELEERRQAIADASNAVAPLIPHDEQALESRDLRGMIEIPILSGLDDFARYMMDSSVREAILDRFLRIVRPLAQAGRPLVIVAHSWGTVVAYEGMRRLDAETGLNAGAVTLFFTCGAALSIGAVRRNLFGRVADGRRPKIVGRWLNLNARGDVVGGRLFERGYAVNDDRVDLESVGCRWFPPDPICAHGSYFVPENRVVNHTIFGDLIEGG
jgi:hypothetical protein